MKTMKRMTLLFALMFLAGCSNASSSDLKPMISGSKPDSLAQPSKSTNPSGTEEKNILVTYFTWSNNTQDMASHIHDKTGGMLSQIVPVKPYPTTSYTQWGNSARDERDNDARPEIKDPLPKETVSRFDTVLIGFPIWWHTAPMIIGTFLESYTWNENVDIYPFFQGASNSNTEYYDNSMAFVRRCAKGTTVHEGLYTAYNNTARIDEYLTENELMK